MKNALLVMLSVGMVLAILVSGASATSDGSEYLTAMPLGGGTAPASGDYRGARVETLWIFDADFHDTEGDNAGWTAYDRSGTIASVNYWHHDTIRIQSAFTWLGDSTWWCGRYNECWLQPRGYGNEWLQILKREFPEIEANTNVGDELILEYDQRFAMEHDYDYGYTEISDDDGATWTTVATANNPGFAGKPGMSKDWDDLTHGHAAIDLSSYAGQTILLRFRMESDEAYSSQDEYNNGPPNNTCLDGAWQIDNIELIGPSGTFWLDDSESGSMGWDHSDQVAASQTGVIFERGLFGTDFLTGRPFTCDDRQGWMYAAVDPVTSQMVDGQYSWLMSPPIDISGAPKLVGHWDFWLDMPRDSDDICNLFIASDDNYTCVTDESGFKDEDPGWWYGDAGWRVRYDDWDAYAGNDWLAILWAEQHDPPPSGPSGGQHWAGIIFNRQRVGIPSGGAGETVWETDTWNSFNDWIYTQISEALLDSAFVKVKDDDGLVSVSVMASNDGGNNWSSYPCHREDPESDWFVCSPPSGEIVAGAEIMYYFEALDEAGNIGTLPSDAPDRWFEMSILPLNATIANPRVLLVDKHGRTTSGETRYSEGYNNYRPLMQYHSESYYKECLEILGYEYEVYDVEVPSGSTDQSDGPDSTGYKYYDTQIWFTNYFNAYTIKPPDQVNLINWLEKSSVGRERNLLFAGNDIGFELMESGKETLAFYETWLATHYLDNLVGVATVDSVPGLENHDGDWEFMTYEDGACILIGGCPNPLEKFDVIEPFAGIAGTEIVADYVKLDSERRPAGVAYTHQSLGYQTVNLGFGFEYMMDSMQTSRTPGYFNTGIHDRANFLENIMAYFDRPPGGDVEPTGVVGGPRNSLSQAYPNPFNPLTKIAYSIKESGPVTIRVYSAAGRTVRTLLEEELEAGGTGFVVWDGRNDAGERCGSGVYFYRIEAPGFASSRKMVMLK